MSKAAGIARLKTRAAFIARYEIWPLLVGVSLAGLSRRCAPWGLGLLAALWLARWLGNGRLTVRTPLDRPLLVLVVMMPVTLWVTSDVQATTAELYHLLAGLALYYGVVNWAQDPDRLGLLFFGLVALGGGLALFSLTSVEWFARQKMATVPVSVYDALPLWVDNTVHPNMMAGAMVVLLPFPLAGLLFGVSQSMPLMARVLPRPLADMLDHPGRQRLFCLITFTLMLGVLFLTKSRGGWAAGALACLTVLMARWPMLLWLLPAGGAAGGLLAWLGHLTSLLQQLGSGGAFSGWEGRIEIWSRALYMLQDFPFTGIGAGTFQFVANTLYPFFVVGPDADIPHAHNLWLQVGVDYGVPGLVAVVACLVLVGACGVAALRRFRPAGGQVWVSFCWAGLAGMLGMAAHGLVDAVTLTMGRAAFVPWAVMGGLIALYRMAGRNDK